MEPILSDDTAAMNASNAAAEQTNAAANAAALQTEKSRSRSKESDRREAACGRERGHAGISSIGRLENCRKVLFNFRFGSPTISIFSNRASKAVSTISDSSRASICPTHM